MANVVMKMETGRMAVSGADVPAPDKIRKFPDVPQEMIKQVKKLEKEKQGLAAKREKAKGVPNPALIAETKKLMKKLHALWDKIRQTQYTVQVKRRAFELDKQAKAAAKAKARAGHAKST